MSDAELIRRLEDLAAEEYERWTAPDHERSRRERWTAGAEWASFMDQIERLESRPSPAAAA